MISHWKYLNVKNKLNFFQDWSSYTENMKVFDVINGPRGCVNTIEWDNTGTRILSGGDDKTLRIHQYMSDWNKPWTESEVFQIELSQSRNILTAKFLPVYNNQIVSGSKCGSVYLVDINQSACNLPIFYRHSGPVLNIATFNTDPFNFISVSNDKTLCMFDIRKSLGQPTVKMQFPCALSSIAIHPIDNNKIATGGSDSFVRIFDRRVLNKTNIEVNETLSMVMEICRPLEFPLNDSSSNRSPLNGFGKQYINSISFEPRFGRYLLVNYMYDSIYLYDTQTKEDGKQIYVQQNERSTSSSNSTFRIQYNWDNTGPPRDGGENENAEIICPPSIQSILNNLQQKEMDLRNSSKSEFNPESELKSVVRYKQIQIYDGHQNCRTMIKDTRFWGDNYILSGSECGHILVWRRNEKGPVFAILTDQRVTNRIEPHPFLPIIATCGIDYNVKIVGSTLEPVSSHEEKKEILDKIIRQNQTRTETARNSQSISMVDLLRIMRVQRIINRTSDRMSDSNS